jgi:putative endonuclease
VHPARRPGGPDDRIARGRDAETRVAEEMEARGGRILCRNLRAGRYEIDLVVLRAGVVRIIEVRSRVGRSAGDPLETIGPAKRRALARAVAGAVARGLLPRGREIRYDVATVVWDAPGAPPEVRVYENAFDALDLL